MTAETSPDLPFHLRGNFAPVFEEREAVDLPVRGAIPPELEGLYLRNGPNPKSGTSNHWFMGDGMVHGVALGGGRAKWYRNRWVRTRPFLEGDEEARLIRDDNTVDLTVAKANTNVVCHAGRILALVESSFPTQLDRRLDTVGLWDFEGRLRTAMTAHPKLCPTTGEMHFFGYGFAPAITYHRVDAHGVLVQSETIEVGSPTMMHDFAITESHVIFLDLPVVFDMDRAMAGQMPYKWSESYGARLGVMPRGGSNADVRWFEVEPCYIFHPLNAHTRGETVVIDVARYPELWREHHADFRTARLHRYEIDLAGGGVKETPLDDRGVEFPRVDPRREGLSHRFGYAVRYQAGPDNAAFHAIVQYDLERGSDREHDFGDGRVPGEGVFVPAGPDAAEDAGWVLAFVYDAARNGSDLVVLDASALDAAPVATVALPQRVPFGFHGNWVPESALG